jgi:hypothetical protein
MRYDQEGAACGLSGLVCVWCFWLVRPKQHWPWVSEWLLPLGLWLAVRACVQWTPLLRGAVPSERETPEAHPSHLTRDALLLPKSLVPKQHHRTTSHIMGE